MKEQNTTTNTTTTTTNKEGESTMKKEQNTTTTTTSEAEKKAKRSESAKKGAETRKKNREAAKLAEAAKKAEAERGKLAEEQAIDNGLEENRGEELRKLREEKAEAEKRKAAKKAEAAKAEARAIDSAPASIREKLEALREEVKAENAKRDTLADFSEALGKFGRGERIDWFKARRSLASRVLDYMKANAWKAVITSSFDEEIQTCEAALAKAREEGAEAELVAACVLSLENAKKSRADIIREECSFSFSKDELAKAAKLAKALTRKDKATQLVSLLYELSGLNLEGNQYVESLLRKIGECKPLTALKMAGSGMTRANGTLGGSYVLRVVYGDLFETLLSAGTVKPAYIPEEVREKYAPSNAAKKAKKNNK